MNAASETMFPFLRLVREESLSRHSGGLAVFTRNDLISLFHESFENKGDFSEVMDMLFHDGLMDAESKSSHLFEGYYVTDLGIQRLRSIQINDSYHSTSSTEPPVTSRGIGYARPAASTSLQVQVADDGKYDPEIAETDRPPPLPPGRSYLIGSGGAFLTGVDGAYLTTGTEMPNKVFASSKWTGLPSGFALSTDVQSELVTLLNTAEKSLESVGASNSEKAMARAYIVAARTLVEVPEPPTDLIWELINRANALAGIASLLVSIFALFMTASK